jgi:thymidylate synthase
MTLGRRPFNIDGYWIEDFMVKGYRLYDAIKGDVAL